MRSFVGAFELRDYESAFEGQGQVHDDSAVTGNTAVSGLTISNGLAAETQGGKQTRVLDDSHRRTAGTAGTQHESTHWDPLLSLFSLSGCTANTLQSAFTFLLHPVATTQKLAAAPLQPAMKAWDGWTKASEPFKSAAVGGAVSLLGLVVLRTAVNTATDVKTCLDAWSRPIGSSVG